MKDDESILDIFRSMLHPGEEAIQVDEHTIQLKLAAECAACGGDGIDGSHNAAAFYAYSGKLSPCPACDGSGRSPHG